MAIANITNNILVDSGVATSSLLPLSGGTLTGALNGTSATFTGGTQALQLTSASDVYLNVTRGSSILNVGVDASSSFYNTNTGHRFYTNSGTITALSILSNGNVGILNNNPQTLLSVENSGTQNVVSPIITSQSTGTTYGGMYSIRDGAGDQRGLIFQNYTANVGLTEKLRITSDGVIRAVNLAGTGSRAVLADTSGNLSAPVSDLSVKQNITSIGYGLNEIIKMNPVWFDFIDDYKNYGAGRQNGNIAQEMKEIIPEAVFITPSTGKMGINYDQLHAVYIKAIQELKAEIDQIKNK
jgi:hypothetical protein